MGNQIHSTKFPRFSDVQEALLFELVKFIAIHSEIVIARIFFKDAKGLLRTLHIRQEEVVCIFSRLNNFIGSYIFLSITCLHSSSIRNRQGMMTNFFSKSGKFVCESVIIYYKTKILLDNTESFTRTVDIGVNDCWVHDGSIEIEKILQTQVYYTQNRYSVLANMLIFVSGECTETMVTVTGKTKYTPILGELHIGPTEMIRTIKKQIVITN